MAEIEKYLGVLPVPFMKTDFQKWSIFMNFCIFFLLIDFAEIILVESLAQMGQTA